jgi:hypothetical protein
VRTNSSPANTDRIAALRVHPGRGVFALVVCLAAIVVVYAPVLRFGLVAEDFQFALKGAKIAEHPLELFWPFQLVWRPGVYALFAVLAWAAGPLAIWYRVAQLAAGLALTASGWLFLRRAGRLGPWVAAATVLVWLLSPLANEPLCGEASFVGHLAFGASTLLALWLHAGAPSRVRRTGVALTVLVAAACNEEWVVVPSMLVVQNLALHGRTLRQALWDARWWVAAVGAYLAAYAAITHFAYAGIYRLGVAPAAAKVVATLMSFMQLSAPATGSFEAVVGNEPWQAGAAVLVFGAMVVFAVRRRLRRPLLLFACSALAALPTLTIGSQTARWTFLPWFFFLGGVVVWLRESAAAVWQMWPLRVCGAALLLLLAGAGGVTTRRDVADWGRFARLTATLENQLRPLLVEGAKGRWLEVLRSDDSRSWKNLVSTPEGQAKQYFPRPDDPYGIVSLSALLSWQSYRNGWVLEREESLPAGAPAVAFVHVEGGFRRLAAVPRLQVRHPLHPHSGVAGVILRPRPWAEFAPREFP